MRGLVNEVIVVAQITHREGMIDEYEKQLTDAGIPFYWHQIPALPCGANSITAERRIAYIRDMAQQFRAFQHVVMTDAWDVLFYGTKEELVAKLPENMIVSAERNCYPEAHLTKEFTSESPWRYANNGMLAGAPEKLLRWCDLAEKTQDLGILDQAWFNRRCLDSRLVWLDETTSIFYVVSAWLEDGSLKMKDGRPWNSKYDTFPSLFHFSGKCNPESFRQLLSGNISAL
jgi:hypothetical protein